VAELYVDEIGSPVGRLLVAVDGAGSLVALAFRGDLALDEAVARFKESDDAVTWSPERCAAVADQLGEYFRRERRAFDLALAPRGTPFEQAVWAALLTVPYGTLTTYGNLARRLGKPDAVRAVGRANGANPIVIVIPCHRVIGADGTLTGYGGGLAVKRWLLALEGAMLPGLGI